MKIVSGEPYLEEIRALIVEYTQSLGRDLTFQNLSAELADLSTKYVPPHGRLLAALSDDGAVVGCVAFCRHSAQRCEMKRLYVRPACRGQGIGQQLIEQIIAAARQEGYAEMVLDTLLPMQSAIRLYRSFGFREIPPYYNNPMPDVLYLRLALS